MDVRPSTSGLVPLAYTKAHTNTYNHTRTKTQSRNTFITNALSGRMCVPVLHHGVRHCAPPQRVGAARAHLIDLKLRAQKGKQITLGNIFEKKTEQKMSTYAFSVT